MLDETLLAAVLDAAPCGVLVLRIDSEATGAPRIVQANRRIHDVLGHRPHELVGRSLRVLRSRGRNDEALSELDAACRDGRTIESVIELRDADGELRSCRVRGAPLAGERAHYVLWIERLAAPMPLGGPPPGRIQDLEGLLECWPYTLEVDVRGGLRTAWVDSGLIERLGTAQPGQPPDPFAAVVAEDLPVLRRKHQLLLRGERVRVCYRLQGADGKPFAVEDRARPLVGPHGLVEGACGVLRPETVVRAERRGDVAACARIVGQVLHALALVIDANGTVLGVSDEPATPIGDRLRQAVGRDLSSALPAPIADLWLDHVDRALSTGERQRFVVTLQENGTRGEYEIVVAALDADRVLAVVQPAAEVVSELPPGLAEPALPEFHPAPAEPRAAHLWRLELLDLVADGVIGTDDLGTILWLNRAAETIFGYPAEELIGRRFDVLLASSKDRPESFSAMIEEIRREPTGLAEVLGRRRDGEVIPIEVFAAAIERSPGGYALTVRDITVRRQTEEAIRALAYYDPLTTLPNRLLFHDRLGQAIERARRNRQYLAVMLVDLDRFKLINDSLGLQVGDAMLRAVGERLRETLRKSDTVARLGGDEFMILLHGIGGAEAAAKVAQKLLDCLRTPFIVNGDELDTSACIGIAMFPHDGGDPDSLIKNADTALSRAKEQGRNHYQFYTTDMNAAAFERLMLESRLRRALSQKEFVVYYQPQLSLETGRVVGVEALLRWFHPDHGMVPPSEFIPLAEETGLIVPIGEWVLETACAQVGSWHAEGFPELRLAVNLSARQFQQRDLVDRIVRLTDRLDFPPEKLELELTESVVMRDASESVLRLRALTASGVQLALDDFGTGYSSLGYLRNFPIRSLKIDRTFVHDIATDPTSAALCRAIVALGTSLQLKVVAEGVETVEQLRLLRAFGCHEIQGYLYSRPLPAGELLALLKERRPLPTDNGD